MPKETISVPSYMDITGNSTVVNVGAPLALAELVKAFTDNSINYELRLPGSQNRDLEEFVAQVVATAENGSSQTTTFELEGCIDPVDSYTNVNNSGGYAVGDTSIVVDDGASIGTGTVAIPALVAVFEEEGNTRRLTKYEWVMITSISTNTLTVTRGVFGTDAIVIPDDAFVFYSNSWYVIEDTNGNDIKLNNLSTEGATAASPKTGEMVFSVEGLTGSPTPFLRVKQSAPNSGGITYKVHLSGRLR